MIPQIENSITNTPIEIMTYPSKTYRANEFQIAGYVDELDAVRQSIEHILSIERYAYLIYDDNYGVELEQYIGQDLSFLEATIEDTLKEALTQDDRIVDVKVTNISTSYQNQSIKDIVQTENSEILGSSITKVLIAIVEFDVYCKQGVIHTEVNINV